MPPTTVVARKVMFSQACQEFCPQGGEGVCVSQHAIGRWGELCIPACYGGGYLPLVPGVYTPLGRQSSSVQTHCRQTPPWTHPLGSLPPDRHPPLGRHPPQMSNEADGMHPTGMYSCFLNIYTWYLLLFTDWLSLFLRLLTNFPMFEIHKHRENSV